MLFSEDCCFLRLSYALGKNGKKTYTVNVLIVIFPNRQFLVCFCFLDNRHIFIVNSEHIYIPCFLYIMNIL